MKSQPLAPQTSHLLFEGSSLQHAGDLLGTAMRLRELANTSPAQQRLVFEVASGRQVDVDLSGTRSELKARYQAADIEPAEVDVPTKAGRGRPRLGVVGREVTLLPRHWAWLEAQRGGASAALRRLIDQARRDSAAHDRIREAQDRGHRFMSAMAGDLPGYEEAMRALFAADRARFMQETERWPKDVRYYARALAADAFADDAALT